MYVTRKRLCRQSNIHRGVKPLKVGQEYTLARLWDNVNFSFFSKKSNMNDITFHTHLSMIYLSQKKGPYEFTENQLSPKD